MLTHSKFKRTELFSSKLTWRGDIHGDRGAVEQVTLTDITTRAINEAIRGISVSYRSDTDRIELRADPAPEFYLTSDDKQCRNVTVTILINSKVVNSFSQQTCASLDVLLPPVKKGQ